jgi:hypothetical protein
MSYGSGAVRRPLRRNESLLVFAPLLASHGMHRMQGEFTVHHTRTRVTASFMVALGIPEDSDNVSWMLAPHEQPRQKHTRGRDAHKA